MWTALVNKQSQARFDHFGAPKTPSQFFGSLKFLIFLRFLSMVQFLGSAKIIIFTIFKLVPILWVSQFLSTLRYVKSVFQNSPENRDPCCKMDLDFFGTVLEGR